MNGSQANTVESLGQLTGLTHPVFPRRTRMAEKWIAAARERMAQRDTEGAFTRQAKAAGKTVAGYATQVLKPGSKASTTTKRRAVFARNVGKLARGKR